MRTRYKETRILLLRILNCLSYLSALIRQSFFGHPPTMHRTWLMSATQRTRTGHQNRMLLFLQWHTGTLTYLCIGISSLSRERPWRLNHPCRWICLICLSPRHAHPNHSKSYRQQEPRHKQSPRLAETMTPDGSWLDQVSFVVRQI